jgi:2-succinyl-5-enolpyruvyl-6-hydroxy-3-cyclohexene-1-carboxylate synthase
MSSCIPTHTTLNTLWGFLLIEECIRNGINYFCISPGSRSAPLTAAVARHSGAKTLLCHDERGAGFHALGYARSARKPAVLICTSGTAAAHYLPAVIEAAMDRLPMLVLSADRPPELQESGANQTIRQSRLFGSYTKWNFDLPCPDEAVPAATLLTTMDQAIYQTQFSPQGPVHLNCPFREPLTPGMGSVNSVYWEPLTEWAGTSHPWTRYVCPIATSPPAAFARLNDIIEKTQQGLISIGRLATPLEREAVHRLLAHLQWPVFADVMSGLRLGYNNAPVIPYFDRLLLDQSRCDRYRPDTLLHIGDQLTSKRFLEFIEKNVGNVIYINNHPFRHDPCHTVSLRLEMDIDAFCLELMACLPPRTPTPQTHALLTQSATVDAVVSDFILSEQKLSEISTARLVSENIPAHHGLWLGNSMPVRDMDMYGNPRAPAIWIGTNRGASGIEGTLASATGFAAGLKAPVTVLLGDLALLHDINSLILVTKSAFPVIIIAINNNGGGIFSFLPIAECPDIFEEYFATPHGVCFKGAAEMFSIHYDAPETHDEFVQAYRTACQAARSTLLEVTTDREENHRLHCTLQHHIRQHLTNHVL